MSAETRADLRRGAGRPRLPRPTRLERAQTLVWLVSLSPEFVVAAMRSRACDERRSDDSASRRPDPPPLPARSVCAAVGMTSLAATVFDLRRIAAAAAAAPATIKALVCVFLYGGNDSNNMLVPRGTDYAGLRRGARRPGAARRRRCWPITPLSGGDGRQWGLHPSLRRLHSLFDAAAARARRQRRPAGGAGHPRRVRRGHGRAAAAALLAQRPDGALADRAPRPAGAHRLGRPRRRPAALAQRQRRRSRCRCRSAATTRSRSAAR